jgi:nucleolar pre-ribosomal-associated protein 2
VNGLERLVVLHVVLPLRDQFFSLKPAPVSNPDYAVSAHLKVISDEIETGLSSDVQGEQLPIFFDIAIRSVPRATFRRQLNEEPWLETLFIAIAARLGCSILADSTQDRSSEAVTLLQQLLEVVIGRKLRVSHPTLSKYATRYSGLIEDTEAPTRWRLISQIIELNVDVFLPNSGYADAEVLLNALLYRITAECFRFTPLNTELSKTLKNDIVVRLLQGFSGARDLDTFVELWKEQLATLESARSNDCYFYSIWEDDVLLRAYGELISTTLPIQHIKNQLELLTAGIDIDRKATPMFAEYTKILLIDALLMSNPSRDGRFVDDRLFDRIYAIACSILSPKKEAPHWRWRLWRITQNLLDRYPPSVTHFPANLVDAMVRPAIKGLQEFAEKSGTSNVNECREAYYSFQFLGFMLTKANIPEGDEYLNTLVLSFSTLLSGLGDSKESGWNGQTETLTSSQTVAIGCLTVILADPPIVERLSSDSRRLLFNTLLSAISSGSSSLSSPGDTRPADDLKGQLLNIWTSFLSADWIMLVGPAVYDLVSVIATRLPKDARMRPLLVKSLLSIPTRLMPPHLRVSISDSLQDFLISEKHDADEELDWLVLMKRLVELPKYTTSIVTDWTILWRIASSISPSRSHSPQSLIHAFSQLQRAIVGRVMISSEITRREYLQGMVDKVRSFENDFASSTKYESMQYVLCCLSLNWVHQSPAELADDSRVQTAVTLREAACQTAVGDLQSLARQVKRRPEDVDEKLVLATLSVLDIFPDLLGANKEVRKAAQKLDGYVGRSDMEPPIQKRVKCQRIARIKSDSGLLTEFLACAQSFRIQHPNAVEESAFVCEVKRRVSAMSAKKIVDLLRGIEQQGFADDNAVHTLILTGIATISVAALESRESPEAIALSSLLTTLTNALPRFNSPEPFCLAAECIDLLLRTHPKSVSQWNIDNILAAASIATSHSGPQIAREYAGTVHDRLCRTLGTVFGLYRKKVSGRFHLILPPLQRLLRCLFSRDSRAAKASPVQSELPPWFGNMEETPLRAEHASQYCRLLSSLTDPTVSAVQLQGGSQANQALSDSTKKAKSLAGQYLQYLIIEYAGTQLRGHLSPEAKAALMPGLYSVLDVMSRENMRAMNAAMDSSSRAMFKGLYDDYVRFGKWNNE